MTAGDLLLRRRRLGLDQNAASKLLGLNPGALVDLERERFTVSPEDIERWMSAYEAWEAANKPREAVTT